MTVLFTACPDPNNARALRSTLNSHIRTDLEIFCAVASKSLPADAGHALASVRQMPVAERLNPLVYVGHQNLQAALKAQDAPGARTALRGLSSVACRTAAADAVEVSSLEPGPLLDALAQIAASHESDGAQSGDATHLVPVDAAAQLEVAGWVRAALAKIGEADPDMRGEIEELVSEVRIYDGIGPRGVTSIYTFGSILVRWPADGEDPVRYMIENLAHEASHLALYALMAIDPLLHNAFVGTFKSPLRADPRPLYGIFHQTFVLARLNRLWDRLVRIGEDWAEERLVRDHGLFADGYRTIRGHGQLTPAGEQVADSLSNCCR